MRTYFRVTAVDEAGKTAVARLGPIVLLDAVAPVVEFGGPWLGAPLVTGSVVQVEWTVEDESDIVAQTLEWSPDGGTGWSTVSFVLPASRSLLWTVPSLPSKTGRLRLTVTDAANNPGVGLSPAITIVAPNTPPSSPSNPLPADGTTAAGVAAVLRWDSADSDPGTVLSFEVRLAPGSGTLGPVATVGTTSYTATLLPQTSYRWQIAATDGFATVAGPVWSFTTGAPQVAGPAGFAVLESEAALVKLGWTGPATGQLTIERQESDGPWGEIASVPASQLGFDDAGVKAHTTYSYRATRVVGTDASVPSPVVTVGTKNTPPAPPLPVMPPDGATGVLLQQLSWSATDDDGDALEYRVFFGATPDMGVVALGQGETVVAIPSLQYGSTYYWRVEVTDEVGALATGPIWSFATPPVPVPEAPSDLTATIDGDYVVLSWTDNSTTELGFQIERQVGSDWELAQVTVESAVAVILKPGVNAFRVVAFNLSGSSAAVGVTVSGGCVEEGSACEDGDACTVGDACAGGSCQPGEALDCSAGGECWTGVCQPAIGCEPVTNGASCSDGNACTSDDQCGAGVCGGDEKSCADSDACTIDACAADSGCTHQPTLGGSCDDGDACTTGDICQAAGCAGDPKSCNDGVVCTKDSCAAGICVNEPVTCDDDNVCTTDECNADGSCGYAPKSGSCDDGNPCTSGDSCTGGVCAGTAAPDCCAAVCDDDNPCTVDQCVDGECSFVPKLGCCSSSAQCDENEACMAGACVEARCAVCTTQSDCGSPDRFVCVELTEGRRCLAACTETCADEGDKCQELGDLGAVCVPAGETCGCVEGPECVELADDLTSVPVEEPAVGEPVEIVEEEDPDGLVEQPASGNDITIGGGDEAPAEVAEGAGGDVSAGSAGGDSGGCGQAGRNGGATALLLGFGVVLVVWVRRRRARDG